MDKIEYDLQDVVKETLKELERQGKLKNPYDKSPYKKAESLMYNLASFYDSMEFHEKQIETLKEYGVPKRSKSVTTYLDKSGTIERKEEIELLEEKIASEQKLIYRTQIMLDIIENAIDSVIDDKGIGDMLFRYGKTPSEIAEELQISESTVSVAKRKFIKALSVRLFPDGSLEEALYGGA